MSNYKKKNVLVQPSTLHGEKESVRLQNFVLTGHPTGPVIKVGRLQFHCESSSFIWQVPTMTVSIYCHLKFSLGKTIHLLSAFFLHYVGVDSKLMSNIYFV